MKRCCVPVWVMMFAAAMSVQAEVERVPLWPQGAPHARQGPDADHDPDVPTLDLYLPEKSKALPTAVVVCPGGGYGTLAMGHEGRDIGRWFNERGVAAFVLRYRHAPRYRHPVPLTDVRRAIRHVRANAGKFGVKADRIGVMGFSAGGHLASSAATHFEAGKADADDPVERVSSRPDFAILCYPVISVDRDKPYTHKGSSINLLGKDADPKLIDQLSNERRVTPQTPPVFLFHTDEDRAVPPENSVLFYLACRRAGVPAELHVYRKGRHGVGLAPNDPVLKRWPDRLRDWLEVMGFLKKQ